MTYPESDISAKKTRISNGVTKSSMGRASLPPDLIIDPEKDDLDGIKRLNLVRNLLQAISRDVKNGVHLES